MSKFSINFIVDAKHLGDVMASLQPYKIEDLGFKLVAGTSHHPRAGEKPAWEAAVELADPTTPKPLVYFKQKLLEMGFKNGTVYNALETACRNKMLARKMVGGKPYYVRLGGNNK